MFFRSIFPKKKTHVLEMWWWKKICVIVCKDAFISSNMKFVFAISGWYVNEYDVIIVHEESIPL